MADSAPSVHNRYHGFTENLPLFSRSAVVARCQHTDWELCESIRLQELNEARDRAAQMEKTMRWWSECTASWREKWSTVRDERNRAREEGMALRNALEETKDRLDQLLNSKREIEGELMRVKGALHRHSTQNLARNMPAITIEPLVQMDEQTEAIPTQQNAITQTDERFTTDALTNLHQRNTAHFAGREKCLSLESKVASLESELSNIRLQCREMETAKQQAMEEVAEMKKCNEENLKNALDTSTNEVQKLVSDVVELRDENESLKEENMNLHREIDGLRRMMQLRIETEKDGEIL